MMNNEASKLKPFDLEKALKGEKVVTRDGREVEQIFYFDKAVRNEYPLRGVINGGLSSYTREGRVFLGGEMAGDLFMAPKERVVWVNLFKDKTDLPNSYGRRAAHHLSQENADIAAGKNSSRIGNRAYPITIEEE